MKNPINNTVFDSRDLIEYKEYLQQELIDKYNDFMNDKHESNEDIDEWEDIDDVDDITDEDFIDSNEDDISHLESITNFCDELEDYGDFKYGEVIIHEDYWVEYCEELCKDLGEIPSKLPWYIENHIDWDGVADELKIDYTTATYDGDEYYMRA